MHRTVGRVRRFPSVLCGAFLLVLLVGVGDGPALGGDTNRARMLQGAIMSGDLDKVKTLLKDSPDLDLANTTNALRWAAYYGHREIAEVLLAYHADVNGDGGSTPLHTAASITDAAVAGYPNTKPGGHREVAELLIAANAHVDAVDRKYGQSPLHAAAISGNKDVAKVLLANWAHVNAEDNEQKMPLHLAAFNGRAGVVELLLAHKALVNAKDKNGDTALNLAVLRGYKEIVKLLLASHADVNAVSSELGNTPLHLAAKRDHADLVELLLSAHADVNAKNARGETPLHLAKHKDVAELLMAANADVNAKDDHGRTPLFAARLFGYSDVADLLRQHGGH